MAEVFDMQRNELYDVLARLSTRLNRYAELYTNIKGDFYVKDAYARLRDKFGRVPENYEGNALVILGQDPEFRSILDSMNALLQRTEKVTKRIDAEKDLAQLGSEVVAEKFIKTLLWSGGFFLVGFLVPFFWVVMIGCIWYAVKLARVLDFEDHIAEAKSLKESLELKDKSRLDMISDLESRLWTTEFNSFCERPENAKIISDARRQTREALEELNRLDFSDYGKFPKKYQNNIDIQRAFELVETGRASDWEKCANVMAKEDVDQKHFKNQDTMIKNQDIMIDNQERMLHNQDKLFDEMHDSNQQIEELNYQIDQMAKNIERHAVKQERRLSQIAANQGVQIFQSKKMHKEQLLEMRKSVASIQETIYNRPIQVHYHNTTMVEQRR
ncbi:hypothetical protein FAX13_03635 [Ligilactobacillus animalis]|nr:hypothetical protein FAX13_03635 [Ligilactobacillus animalis]